MRRLRSLCRPSAALTTCLLAFGVLAGESRAQNALGDGRALDNNLRVGSGGVNEPGRNYRSEFRARQAIVTGNAPSGLSFRGSVGYTAESDFRGDLPSDPVFAFERDSLLSGFATRGVRGVDALQFQRSFTTGVAPPELSLPIDRPGGGASASQLRVRASDSFDDLDPFSLRRGALRSSAAHEATSSLSLRLLGQGELGDGSRVYSVASPLRGVSLQRTPDYPSGLPRDALEALQDRDAERFGVLDEAGVLREPGEGEEGEEREPGIGSLNRIESERPSDRVEAEQAGARATTRMEPARAPYQRLINRLRAEYREQFGEVEEGDGEQQTEPRPSTIPQPPDDAGAEEEEDAGTEDAPGAGEQTKGRDANRLRRFDQTLRALRERLSGRAADDEEAEGAEDVEALVDRIASSDPLNIDHLAMRAGPERDLVAEQMTAGEEALSEGRWFDAEERFATALRFEPDNALAAVGRVHAQLGAGLFRSASSNLVELLRIRPELINVRFDASLRPTGDRFDQIVGVLRLRIEESRSPGFQRSLGLLLAYLGFQGGEDALVRQGFAAIDQAAEEEALPDPLITVLRRVWSRDAAP